MDKKSRKEIEEAMKNARASLEISGFKVTKEMEELVQLKLIGEITHEEFLKRALILSKGE